MTSPWRESMAAVPRHLFIPETIWHETNGGLLPLRRVDDPDGWRQLADGDRFIITQVDDGQPVGPGLAGKLVTSSASMPELVTEMLDHLDAREGHRVLEIGTGTGWNAALLAHRLGAHRVTTVEVDHEVAAHARKALSGAGYGGVTTVVGDGVLGYPLNAPYDCLIATVAARHIPYAWVEQTRPGGRIVMPFDMNCASLLIALTVGENGTATGGVFNHANFMLLRDQRGERGFSSTDEQEDRSTVTQTHIHPSEVVNPYYSLGSIIAIAARVSKCRMAYYPRPRLDDDAGILWIADDQSRSWARLHHDPGSDGPYPVHQYGTRKLWDEVEAAHCWWVDQGRPAATRWQVTVTPEQQQIELISP